jgi:hypothetical protein
MAPAVLYRGGAGFQKAGLQRAARPFDPFCQEPEKVIYELREGAGQRGWPRSANGDKRHSDRQYLRSARA